MSFLRRPALLPIVLAACAAVIAPAARADVITSDQTLEVQFALTGLPQPETDVLFFYLRSMDFFGIGFPADAVFSATLMDGDRVLGTATTSLVAAPYNDPQLRFFAFAAPSSLWDFDNGPRVDLSSLLDGTILGRLLVRADQPYGFRMVQLDTNFELDFGRAIQSDQAQFINSPNYAYPTAYAVLDAPLPNDVPEPATLLLVAGAALAAMATSGRRAASRG